MSAVTTCASQQPEAAAVAVSYKPELTHSTSMMDARTVAAAKSACSASDVPVNIPGTAAAAAAKEAATAAKAAAAKAAAANPRRRYSSWTRARRAEFRRRRAESAVESAVTGVRGPREGGQETTVEGETHICFAQDGSWFQGNINPPHHCVFKIHGKRLPRGNGDVTFGSSSDSAGLILRSSESSSSSSSSDTTDSNVVNNSGGGGGSSSSAYNGRGSPCNSLDSDLVSSAMARLDLDDEDEVDEGVCWDEDSEDTEDEFYAVCVADLETGLVYRLDRVRAWRSAPGVHPRSCRLRSRQLRFDSDQCYRGARADGVLMRQLGPSFVDKGLKVYRGRVAFRYQDQLCYPVTVDGSQWCL